jgi:hypothetical protein
MSEKRTVSRRTSLKTLGATGAAVMLGGGAGLAGQATAKPAASGQDKKALNVVDVAVARFGKGHS